MADHYRCDTFVCYRILAGKPDAVFAEHIKPDEPSKQPWRLPGIDYLLQLSLTTQIIVWTLAGILGASALGLSLTGDFKRIIPLVLICLINGYTVIQKPAGHWTPFIAPALIIILGGAFARAHRQRTCKKEEERMGLAE